MERSRNFLNTGGAAAPYHNPGRNPVLGHVVPAMPAREHLSVNTTEAPTGLPSLNITERTPQPGPSLQTKLPSAPKGYSHSFETSSVLGYGNRNTVNTADAPLGLPPKGFNSAGPQRANGFNSWNSHRRIPPRNGESKQAPPLRNLEDSTTAILRNTEKVKKDLRDEIQSLQVDIYDLQRTIGCLQVENTNLLNQVVNPNIIEELKTAQIRIRELEKHIDTQQERIEELEGTATDINHRHISEVTVEMKHLKVQVENRESTLLIICLMYKDAVNAIQTKDKELRELRSLDTRLTNRLSATSEQLEQARADLEKLKQNDTEFREQQKTARIEIEELQRKVVHGQSENRCCAFLGGNIEPRDDTTKGMRNLQTRIESTEHKAGQVKTWQKGNEDETQISFNSSISNQNTTLEESSMPMQGCLKAVVEQESTVEQERSPKEDKIEASKWNFGNF